VKKHEKALQREPEKIIRNLIEHYRDIKTRWNRKEIGLTKRELKDLIDFQVALNKIRPDLNAVYLRK